MRQQQPKPQAQPQGLRPLPQPQPEVADLAWGELTGNEGADVVMAADIGIPDDAIQDSGIAPVDW